MEEAELKMARQRAHMWKTEEGGEPNPAVDYRKHCKKNVLHCKDRYR